MTKIDKVDLENITLIKKELKLKNISTIKIKKGNYEIELSSSTSSQVINSPILSSKDDKLSSVKNKTSISSKDENAIKSPMVGVAYLSADPQSPAYVKIDQHVKQGDTVLLIEAMKTFNEVKAPRSGIVKKIIVLDNQPVEYGDDLIILE
tara:strand:+ start:316 stop:765 length:450 start_codon:yes stop_codon:yes gene_type:complete